MRNKRADAGDILSVIMVIGMIVWLFTSYSPLGEDLSPKEQQIPVVSDPDMIRIANWNIQIFGDKKASNTEVMAEIRGKIIKHDLIFIQEIRDVDGSAFRKLCDGLPGYKCNITSRAGRSSSKEQYGIIYNSNVNIKSIVDYNPDPKDRWERPPVLVYIQADNYEFAIFNIHVKPDQVSQELFELELDPTLIEFEATNYPYMIIGDLNADCSYYNPLLETRLEEDLIWLLGDNEDTTVSSTDCAYDRIIVSTELSGTVVAHGLDRDIKKEESDHYLIWVTLDKIKSLE